MPGTNVYSAGTRGGVVLFATLFAAWMLVSCAPWYQAYDIGSEEDLTKLSVVPELRKALRDDDPDVRMQSAMAIRRMGQDAKDAIPDLVDTLDDDDYDVRREAANAIEALLGISGKKEEKGKSASKELTPEERDLMVMVHINRLESKDWTARRDAANKLAQMGPDAAKSVPALVAAMLDESDWGRLYNEVRRSAARALGEIRYEARAANPALIKASTFQDYDVRLEAVRALGKIGPKSEIAVIEALKAALKDSDFDVRREAANALGGFEVYADGTVPNLVKALSDMDFDVRREAAKSLGRIGPKTDAAVDALVKTLNDEDADVRQAAVEALANVQPEDRAKVLPPLRFKLDDMDEDVRMATIMAIAKFRAGDAETLAALERVGHEDQSFTVKKAALETLYVLKGVDAGGEMADAKASRPARKVAVSSGKATTGGSPVTTIHATVDILNIRELPSVSSRRVGKLLRNESATVLEVRDEWLKIRKSDGVTGYVFWEYTSFVPGPEDVSAVETMAPEARSAAASAPVKASPPVIVAPAPPPPAVAVPAAAAVTAPAVTMIRSTADVLNIRSIPDVKGSRVGRMITGETATVLETQGDWLKIKTADGLTGYVAGEYTEALPSSAPSAAEAAAAPAPLPAAVVPPAPANTLPAKSVADTPKVEKIRSTSDLAIRTEPYGNESVGQLGLNEEAEVIETLAEWIKIRKPDGTTGYVSREYTVLVND